MHSKRWLLPDGIEEFLAPESSKIESLRRDILDCYRTWGYQLVMPPMVENLDSLLTGTAGSLELKTFTLVDQLSGKQLGVRSDMTPQVARIDAHLLSETHQINRLCYCGHLLHTRPSGVTASRAPFQIGAEIFGTDDIASDIEIISLLIETLQISGLQNISIDLGHVAIFSDLAKAFGLSAASEKLLFDKLQRKSIPEIDDFLQTLELEASQRSQLHKLATLNGDSEILKEAAQVFHDNDGVRQHLNVIAKVAEVIQQKYPKVEVHCDLAELRGYDYHTGLVFAAFVAGEGKEIARGGRYNNIGQAFGNARPATGFSTDLVALQRLSPKTVSPVNRILAPAAEDADLLEKIQQLRDSGQVVLKDISQGKIKAIQQNCNQVLIKQGGNWVVTEENECLEM